MRDTELYRHLLGLESPWTVGRVELSVRDQQVDVWAEHPDGVDWQCPECGRSSPLHDHSEERAWRHLDSCQFKTILRARPPRVRCSEHGVRQVKLPWAEGHGRFTILFERLAIDVLLETSVMGAASILRVSWDEMWRLMQRAVARGLVAKRRRVIPQLGVDEKSVGRGQKYVTVVCDLEQGTVEYVGDGRREASLDDYYAGLTKRQLAGIEAVAMDMWQPYIESTLANVPDADLKIVFDRFHIAQHMAKAVDAVRRQENRDLLDNDDNSLVGTQHMWRYKGENMPEKYVDRFEQLRASHLRTGRAWAIAESLRELWNQASKGWATRLWKKWYFWATHSRLRPVIKVAQMVKDHLANVLTYYDHRITNAMSEGLNSKIQTIKKMACGYRNREHLKIAIFFHCGGLMLYPTTHANP